MLSQSANRKQTNRSVIQGKPSNVQANLKTDNFLFSILIPIYLEIYCYYVGNLHIYSSW